MGRVDEALRRTAESGGIAPAAATPPMAESLDVAFPVEQSQRESDVDLRPAPEDPAGNVFIDGRTAAQVDAPPGTLPGPPAKTTLATKLVGDDRMLTSSREQYRRLAATLHHLQATSGVKVILIASAVAGEGKTLTAANLALTFSESYERHVLLIDADLRRPSLARTFNIPGEPGLSDGLIRGHQGKLPLHQISSRLTVLPAGRATSDPMAGLTSDRMRQLIAEARGAFDWVIVDTPPIGLMTDANLLSAIADGSVLVVKANATPYHLVQRAIAALGEGHLLGTVLNRATVSHRGSRYYDYYHYAPAPNGSAAP